MRLFYNHNRFFFFFLILGLNRMEMRKRRRNFIPLLFTDLRIIQNATELHIRVEKSMRVTT